MTWYFAAFDLLVLTAEFNTLYHPDLRQAVFIKDEDRYLNVSRVGKYRVYNIFDCTFKCLSSPSCLSLNLAAAKGDDGKLWCEILSSVKYDNPEEYKRNNTSHHYSIKVGLTEGYEFEPRGGGGGYIPVRIYNKSPYIPPPTGEISPYSL